MRSAACAALLLPVVPCLADNLKIESVKLPALRVNGQPARAHTQGLEVLGGQWVSFDGFLERGFQRRSVVLPKQNEIELAREGMAISGGLIHFLPEDLGTSNRMFRVCVADLMQRSAF